MARQSSILRGIRVADFSWVGVGPVTTKYLADHGAEVIRIESIDRPDTLRRAAPFVDGVPGYERSGHFFNLNSSKKSIALDMTRPEGQEVARRLIEHSDVVAESFTSRVMAGWGLDYESVRAIKPDIVYISMSMEGRTGRHKDNLGFGTALQAMAGYSYITGWADRDPTIPSIPYTDWLVPQLTSFALLSALEYRRVSGEGQWIDASQLEAGMLGLTTLMLDATFNGADSGRIGNADRYDQRVPHAVFRCRGEDRWIAIVVHDDGDWARLVDLVKADGATALTDHPEWSTLAGRLPCREEIEFAIDAWTSRHDPHELMHRLQEAGIDAGVVQNQQDVTEDPQLTLRGHAQPVDHPEVGVQAYDSYSFRFDGERTPLGPAPLLGQHTREVLVDALGLSEEEFISLVESGVTV